MLTVKELNELIADGAINDIVDVEGLVTETNNGVSKKGAGSPYIQFVLQDSTGSIKAVIWSCTEKQQEEIKDGAVLSIFGATTNLYGDLPQIKFTEGKTKYVVRPESDKQKFKLTPIHDPIGLKKNVIALVDSISNTNLRCACLSLLAEDTFSERFWNWPAAKSQHHAEEFGLLYHTARMMMAGDAICKVYTAANRDLVIAGCLFHDYGKIWEMKPTAAGNGEYTEYMLLGHIPIGAMKVKEFYDEGRLTKDEYLQLAHIVLAHHGQLEWGSPVTPKTFEAKIVHALDSLDAEYNKLELAFLKIPEGETNAKYGVKEQMYHPFPIEPHIPENSKTDEKPADSEPKAEASAEQEQKPEEKTEQVIEQLIFDIPAELPLDAAGGEGDAGNQR